MDREIGFETMDNGSHDFLLSCFRDMPGLAGGADRGKGRGNQPHTKKAARRLGARRRAARASGGKAGRNLERDPIKWKPPFG